MQHSDLSAPTSNPVTHVNVKFESKPLKLKHRADNTKLSLVSSDHNLEFSCCNYSMLHNLSHRLEETSHENRKTG